MGKLEVIIVRYYKFFDWPERPDLLNSNWGGLSGQSKNAKVISFFIAQRVVVWYFVFTFSLAFIELWYQLHIFSFPYTRNVVGSSLWDKTFHNIWDRMLMTQILEENRRNWLNERSFLNNSYNITESPRKWIENVRFLELI